MFRKFLLKVLLGVLCLSHIAWGINIDSDPPPKVFKFKMIHFLPSRDLIFTDFLNEWKRKIEDESQGRIQITIQSAVEAGMDPKRLYSFVKDDIVDFVWTLADFTPDKFLLTKVFELPFMSRNAPITTEAVMTYYERFLWKEFQDVHSILLTCVSNGVLHMRNKRVRTLEDLKNLKIRVPVADTMSAAALRAVRTIPKPMNASETYDALALGEIDGAFIPWEGVEAFRINKLTKYHTITNLSSIVHLFLMNKQSYNKLSPELRKVIDDNSRMVLAKLANKMWEKLRQKGLKEAKERGDFIDIMSMEQEIQWEKLAQSLTIDKWIIKVNLQGDNGKELYQFAKEMIFYYKPPTEISFKFSTPLFSTRSKLPLITARSP